MNTRLISTPLTLTAIAALTMGVGPVRHVSGEPAVEPLVPQLAQAAEKSKRMKRSIHQVISLYGKAANQRLRPHFERAGIAFPPQRITLLAMKAERKVELWASDETHPFTFIRSYNILKGSGGPGPKLREGDKQIPEGIYRIVALNPNSRYHLSMKLNYPNEFDLRHARLDGRHNPGSNIFIHGKSYSVGCLAMGDHVIEELFVLSEKTGIDNVSVIIAPYDPRKQPLRHQDPRLPSWTEELYQQISAEFNKFQRPG